MAKLRINELSKDDAETGSMVSSTFSLGEPLETASTQSVTDESGLDADFSKVVAGLQGTTIADGQPSKPLEPLDDAEEQPLSKPTTNSVPATPSEDTIEVPLNQCLFCNVVVADVDANLIHMSKQHSMFIPEREYLADLEGLLGFLYEKIHELKECLYCGQVKHTAHGVQTHMRDLGHCMIPYGSEEEMLDIGEFYDFRSTYSDDEETEDEDEEMVDGGVKLGVSRSTKTTVQTGEDGEEMAVDEDEDGWESDASSLSSVPTDEITAMPIDDHSHRYKTLDKHRHHSHSDPRPHRNLDGYHSHAHSTPRAVYHDDVELHLPSGRTAGHRSLHKYFRQNLRNYPSPAERAQQRAIEGRHDSDAEEEERDSRQRTRDRQLTSRANGGLGMVGVSDAKKREVVGVEKRMQKRAQREQMKYQLGNEKRANFQKHFRVSPSTFRNETERLLTFSQGSVAAVDVLWEGRYGNGRQPRIPAARLYHTALAYLYSLSEGLATAYLHSVSSISRHSFYTP